MRTEDTVVSGTKSDVLSLDDRIVAAFADGATSGDVANLIRETEAAATAAGEEAERARERALDPTVPDVTAARRGMDDAAFRRDRLQVATTRLRERLSEVRAQEEDDRRRARYEKVKAERDRLAAELADTYPAIEKQLVDLFTRLDANDMDVNDVNACLPIGANRVLPAVLKARGLDGYVQTKNGRQIVERMSEQLCLPAFEWKAYRPLAWPRET
jgi:hypothetical protein